MEAQSNGLPKVTELGVVGTTTGSYPGASKSPPLNIKACCSLEEQLKQNQQHAEQEVEGDPSVTSPLPGCCPCIVLSLSKASLRFT